MSSISPPPVRRASRGAARLTSAAGWSVVAIAALHTAVFTPVSPWAAWFRGSLQNSDVDHESIAMFWALPGSFVVPVILLGLLMVRIGRQRQRIGLLFALTLVAWVSFCIWLIGPSGFMLVYVPAALLIVASILDRREAHRLSEAHG
jgi:hypothetical protein